MLTFGDLHYGILSSEAELMLVLRQDDFGVSVHWKEEHSLAIWGNAQMSVETLLPQGIKRTVVVTQAWHMPRSR